MERVVRGKVLSAQQLMDLQYQCPFNTNCVDTDYCHPVFRGNQMKHTWHTARNPLQEQDPTVQYNCMIIQSKVLCVLQVLHSSADGKLWSPQWKSGLQAGGEKRLLIVTVLLSHMLVIHTGENTTHQPGDLTSNTTCNCNVTLTNKIPMQCSQGWITYIRF